MGSDLPVPMRLSTVILRDGAIHFIILTVLNALLVMSEYLQIIAQESEILVDANNLVFFIESLTSIIISEFLRHLYQAADAASCPETLTSVSDLEFRIIGPIGASLPGSLEDIAPEEAEEDRDCNPPQHAEGGEDDEGTSSGIEVEEVPRGEARA
ncbi:hypothetical protein GY45DRAFT_1322218 [Cubamyces sp. BRFM 1775]|nr:hypothetical protein GY45DRAFT_1322218 [Cubamyces sp. BRFM 1775]